MNGTFSNEKNSQKIPEYNGFMEFSCTELNEELIEYARIYLNETEETKRKAIEEVKEFVKRELNIRITVPDIVCLCFLRSRKFDVKRACSLMKRAADCVDSHRYLFDRSDLHTVRRVVESQIIGFLPYRDEKGRGIILVQVENWDPKEISSEDLIFGTMVSLHIAATNCVSQVAGFIAIMDFKNFTVGHAIASSSWLIFALQALQRCCPCLVKEFHMVHTPAIIKALWKIAKSVISEKIKQRIFFYKSSEQDKLHRRINPRLLPKGLGGELQTYSYEHWASNIEEIEQKYQRRFKQFLDRNEKALS